MSEVRTRFAPSPTGFMHLGNARTALFAYLTAKRHNGSFVLRIEDTDQERLVEGAEEAIYRDLKWLGIDWDEGPDVGGPFGPYKCSERYKIYDDYLKRIRKEARVYRCFATPEELEQDRKLQASQGKPLKYSGRYRDLSDAESQKRADSGEKFVWRMYVDESAPPITIQDMIRGEVTMSPEVIGDFVLFRSSGIPVFLFANAVDDALMEISHVTRGEDHLSNTFRQVLIYRALGFKEPMFAHMPMIGDTDGGKFSKRAGSLSIENLKEEGFVPAGILNYMALLGWSPGDTAETGEKFTKAELEKAFDLSRVHKGRALYDPKKLRFLNSEHLKDMSVEELIAWAPVRNEEWRDIWPKALELIRHDCATMTELYKVEEFLASPKHDESETSREVLKVEPVKAMLELALKKFSEERGSAPDAGAALQASIKAVGKELGVKGKNLFFPFRVALTAKGSGPEMGPLAQVLGFDEVENRLRSAIEYI